MFHQDRSRIRRLPFFLLLWCTTLFLAGASWSEAAHALIASDGSRGVGPKAWVGVHSGGTIEFYRFVGAERERASEPFKTLQLDAPADEVIYSGVRLGVRTGRQLRFFDETRNFRPLPEYDFQLPEGVSELVLAGDRLGVRTGQEVRFYDITAGYRYLPKFDYTVPVEIGELVVVQNPTGSWLGVRVGQELSFRNLDRNFAVVPDYRFTVPNDTEDLAVVGPLLLVKRADMVEFRGFSGRAQEAPQFTLALKPLSLPEVRSLRGTLLMATGEGREALPFQIWAKGKFLRVEAPDTDPKVISIQRGDTLFTFDERATTGKRQWLGTGLAAMGFVEQIEEVKSAGRRFGAVELDGVQHFRYFYDREAPVSAALAFLSAKTSLPQIWISFVSLEDGTVSRAELYYRDLEANVEIPDEMFALPEGVTFSE